MASLISQASVFLTVFLIFSSIQCEAQLSSTFYDSTCPNALTTIRTAIRAAVASENRMAASLIRLHFHDCFVQGCDGSVLLLEGSGERNAIQNRNSVRGENVIDDVKAQLETICPGVVSCADVLAVAARDASFAVGGPSWTVQLGRRDSTAPASQSEAESDLPRFTDSLDQLINLFDRKGLTARDMVALSGSHTIGQAQCVTFRDRIYSDSSDIDADFATTRQSQCPESAPNGNSNLAPLDLVTPNTFDNNYFTNLIEKKGLLASDQVLFSNGSTDSIVVEYSNTATRFSSDFAAAMVKMGDIGPLTGSQGIIRNVCTAMN